jgi:hypothetical protein
MMKYWISLLVLVCSMRLAVAQEQTPYEIALERIAEAENTEATMLNLAGLGLTEIPPEIGQLTNLENLSVSDNFLVSLPPEMVKSKLFCKNRLATRLNRLCAVA